MQEVYSGTEAAQQAWATTVDPVARVSHTVIRGADGTCLCAPRGNTTNVWARWLANGDVAVLLFNVGPAPAAVVCDGACMAALGPAPLWKVRDVWAHTDNGTVGSGGFATPLLAPGAGSVLLRLTPGA